MKVRCMRKNKPRVDKDSSCGWPLKFKCAGRWWGGLCAPLRNAGSKIFPAHFLREGGRRVASLDVWRVLQLVGAAAACCSGEKCSGERGEAALDQWQRPAEGKPGQTPRLLGAGTRAPHTPLKDTGRRAQTPCSPSDTKSDTFR